MNPTFTPVPPRIKKVLSRRRSRRLKLRILSGLVTAGFVLFILFLIVTAVAFGFFARDLPSPNKLAEKNFQQSTKIFDRNGVLLYNVFGEENRTLVKLDRIPDDLKNATIAIEDQNFYKHKGFDLYGIARAGRDVIFRKKVTGGSTLTQQLVKNALLSPERTVTRKIKEFILAVQIERRYSKDEILQIYLNEIPYGGTAWGSEAASNQYFGKSVWELNLVESAILAGLPQKPTVYSPFGSDPEAYIARTKDVLRRMKEDKHITKEQQDKAVEQLPEVKFAAFGQGIKAPHFSIYVKKLLEEKYGAQLVQTGGLKVTTSLDIKLQNMAQKVVADEIKANGKSLRMSNAAAVITKSKTGEILAMIGSKDYFAKDIQGNFNVATQGLRQPGSALKPFNYITGFEKGYSPATMFLDQRTDFGSGYAPGNYCNCFNGPIPVRVALASSRNIPAVKMLAVNGLENVLNKLRKFGITTLNDPSQYGLSLTLGGGAIKLYELTNAYAILGNGGKSVKPIVILKVIDKEGNIIEEFKPPKNPKEVVKKEHAYLLNNILSDPKAKYLDYGSFWAHQLNFRSDLAVKTGTSEQKIDNWSFGYTPSYVVGVWVGNNDNSPMHPSLSSGVTGAAPIYRKIAEQLLKGKKVESWNKPKDVITVKVDAVSGMKPGKHTTKTKSEIFTKWQAPTQEDDMHKEVRICKPSGLIINASCEAAGLGVTKIYTVLYDPYTKQFQPGFKGCKTCPPTKTDTKVYTPKTDTLTILITTPEDSASVGSDFTVSATITGPNPITGIEFYLDGVLQFTDTSEPYSTQFSSVSVGDHEVMVKAYDDSGDSKEEKIDVTVAGGTPLINSPP